MVYGPVWHVVVCLHCKDMFFWGAHFIVRNGHRHIALTDPIFDITTFYNIYTEATNISRRETRVLSHDKKEHFDHSNVLYRLFRHEQCYTEEINIKTRVIWTTSQHGICDRPRFVNCDSQSHTVFSTFIRAV